MRMMVRANMPVESGNAAIKDGSIVQKVQAILEELKPEAAYFFTENGQRTALLIVDLKEPSQIPAVAEPFFLAFNARVEVCPVMSAEDLMKAAPSLETAVKKYG